MSKLDYDFSLGDDIPHDSIKDAFLNLKNAADSDDPDQRWDALDAMKMLAKSSSQYGGSPELREAGLAVMAQMQNDDPDDEVRTKAEREHSILSHYHTTLDNEMGADLG